MDPLERICWSRSDAISGAEVLFVDNSLRAWHFYHDRYTICACRSASASWRYRGKSLFNGDQSLGIMEPGEAHISTFIYKPMDFNVLLVDPKVFRCAAEECGLRGEAHFRTAQMEDPRLLANVQGLARAVAAAESPLELQTWLALCLHGMLGYTERAPTPRSWKDYGLVVRQCMEILRERCREPVDLQELSTLTGHSRFALVHAFTAQVGMPPHAYQIHLRIARARRLLELGVPPARVAMEVGFSDQSHFNRHFKNVMNVTPGQYAKPIHPMTWIEDGLGL